MMPLSIEHNLFYKKNREIKKAFHLFDIYTSDGTVVWSMFSKLREGLSVWNSVYLAETKFCLQLPC